MSSEKLLACSRPAQGGGGGNKGRGAVAGLMLKHACWTVAMLSHTEGEHVSLLSLLWPGWHANRGTRQGHLMPIWRHPPTDPPTRTTTTTTTHTSTHARTCDEELESLGDPGLLSVRLGQWRDLRRVLQHKGGLHQRRLAQSLKQLVQDVRHGGGAANLATRSRTHRAGRGCQVRVWGWGGLVGWAGWGLMVAGRWHWRGMHMCMEGSREGRVAATHSTTCGTCSGPIHKVQARQLLHLCGCCGRSYSPPPTFASALRRSSDASVLVGALSASAASCLTRSTSLP